MLKTCKKKEVYFLKKKMSPKSPYPANPVEGVSVSVKPTLELDFDVNAGNICNQLTLNFHRHKLHPNLFDIFPILSLTFHSSLE